MNDDSFDILQRIIYDDKLEYYKDRVMRGEDLKKKTDMLERYYFTVSSTDNESKSQGGMDVFVNNPQNYQQKGNHNEGFENKVGGGNYNNGKGDYNLDKRVKLIRYKHDPEHDFNKLLPRNKSDSNLFLSLFNYTYFYNESQYNNFTNTIEVNSKIENWEIINKSNIEDLYLKDIIDNDANHSFLTYKTDVKEFLNIFNKIKINPLTVTEGEEDTLNVFKSKINDILNKFKYYEYDALNVTSPLSDEKYSGETFEKYDSLCSIIDGGGVESVDNTKNDDNYYDDLYNSYFNEIKLENIVKPDFTIKFSYYPSEDKKFLQVKMLMPSDSNINPFNFQKGGFKVDNLACMMMMIEKTEDGVNNIEKNEMFPDNDGLNELYDFINHIWIHKNNIFMPEQTITTIKQYLYRLLFTLKVIGDQGQADFVAKWNNNGENDDKKMIIVTGDRMLFHYCIIKGIPVYFQNKDYIIINTNESIYENIYKKLTGFVNNGTTGDFPDAPFISVPEKEIFCIRKINEYIDGLIVKQGEVFYNDLRDDITTINGYGTENFENFNEVIYNNNNDVLFYEELDEIKDKVIENYLIKYENYLIKYIKNIKNFENITNNKDIKFNEGLEDYINQGRYKKIINYIKLKIITIYDINYTKFLKLKDETNHNTFIENLQTIIEKEMKDMLSTIEEISIGLLFAGKRMASYRKKTNQGSIDEILNDIINMAKLESTRQKLTNELELIVLIISKLVFSQDNILKIEYLKETYLEYLKERLIKIKKNEKFKEISNIIINNVPEDNGELLKEFIRKRVEYKFGSANG